MSIRKNIKFLSPLEKENFVKACVLMKADIVNPGAPVSQQYSKWDELVAIHEMIQSAFAPGSSSVNFGHGGNGAYSFLSWHRYFLYYVEQQLNTYVPGVMMPYWDWTDPSSSMTDNFLGPNGNPSNSNVIERGYFAFDRPGTGSNTTPLPSWWPSGLNGWRMPGMFMTTFQGGLRRRTGSTSGLPTVNAIRAALNLPGYHAFQNAVESGNGLPSGHSQMHNGMHGWVGGGTTPLTWGHMSHPRVSPFDPFFYLHHCNIDRLWAMWQLDGHASVYPTSGGDTHHHRNDLMYPWIGSASGYGTNAAISASIPMPDFSSTGQKQNVDTLDFRSEFGYTYDTLPIIGIGLDRTGSMSGMTPDPMVSTAPDVTKWEAAKRGVSAFLQDCETVQDSKAIYVTAGIKTFRSTFANQFDAVFGTPNFGLIKNGSSFSKASFDSNVGSMFPGGGTPLADALLDVQNTLVEAPTGGVPTDEQRYLAMLTDGILTSGSPMSSITDGSLSRTAIFAMGFGIGSAVDYTTLASMVAKGMNLSTTQIFHGENAGTIDKFFSNSLAAAIGFTSIFDPVVELFSGEHSHFYFNATSADDCFLITAQGMDFQDSNWNFMLISPNHDMLYSGGKHQDHQSECHHCCPKPHITVKRSNGRLSVIVQRHNAPSDCWVGQWQLMAAYKTDRMDIMHMPPTEELLFPVSAGPIRGNQFSRLLTKPEKRVATRNIFAKARNSIDIRAVGTNSNTGDACNLVVNVYARTQLKIDLLMDNPIAKVGKAFDIKVKANATFGTVVNLKGLGRLISPDIDLTKIVSKEEALSLIQKIEKSKRDIKKPINRYDPTMILARKLASKKDEVIIKDRVIELKNKDNENFKVIIKDAKVPGVYHLGLLVEGIFISQSNNKTKHSDINHGDSKNNHEPFSRLLNISVAVE